MSDHRIETTPTRLASYEPEPVPLPKPGPTSSIERNTIERAEQAAIGGSQYNTLGRDTLTGIAKGLRYDQSVEFGCKAVVSKGFAAVTEGKIKIERRTDGRYEVSANANAQLGAGDAHRRATLGVGAGTKFVVESPEAAADIAHAMATLGVSATLNANIGVNFLTIPADTLTGTTKFAVERLHHYREKLVDARIDARGSALLSAGNHDKTAGVNVHGGAETGGAGEIRIDFEKGELIEAVKVSIGAEGRANLNLGGTELAGTMSRNTAGIEGETKTDLRLEKRRHVDPKLLERVKRGELDPKELLVAVGNAKAEWVLVGELEAEITGVGGVQATGKVKLEGELPLTDALANSALRGDLAGVGKALAHVHWKGSAEVGLGKELLADAKAGYVQGGVMTFKKLGETEGSIEECFAHAAKQFADEQKVKAQLEADRAVLNLQR